MHLANPLCHDRSNLKPIMSTQVPSDGIKMCALLNDPSVAPLWPMFRSPYSTINGLEIIDLSACNLMVDRRT
jgi:hypothetical protein